jgi:hypothetical protein
LKTKVHVPNETSSSSPDGFLKKSPPRAEVVFFQKSLPDSFAPGIDGLQLKKSKKKNDEINILLKNQLRRYREKGTL